MVGGVDSVIGADRNAVKGFTGYYPQRYNFARGLSEFNAVLIEVNHSTGRALSIKRIKHNIY
jgi:calcineurin-like phosphoesterase